MAIKFGNNDGLDIVSGPWVEFLHGSHREPAIPASAAVDYGGELQPVRADPDTPGYDPLIVPGSGVVPSFRIEVGFNCYGRAGDAAITIDFGDIALVELGLGWDPPALPDTRPVPTSQFYRLTFCGEVIGESDNWDMTVVNVTTFGVHIYYQTIANWMMTDDRAGLIHGGPRGQHTSVDDAIGMVEAIRAGATAPPGTYVPTISVSYTTQTTITGSDYALDMTRFAFEWGDPEPATTPGKARGLALDLCGRGPC